MEQTESYQHFYAEQCSDTAPAQNASAIEVGIVPNHLIWSSL